MIIHQRGIHYICLDKFPPRIVNIKHLINPITIVDEVETEEIDAPCLYQWFLEGHEE